MYISYIKENDKVLVQNNNSDFEIFDNVDNIDLILKEKNIIETINNKQNELNKLENIEEKEIKKYYLDLKEKLENNKLNNLIDESDKIFTPKKIFKYVYISKFINDFDNELRLIDIYLEIRKRLINHEDLNINFNKNEDQTKKLKFLNLCFSNIDSPENFINNLLDNAKYYNNKQKKLIY